MGGKEPGGAGGAAAAASQGRLGPNSSVLTLRARCPREAAARDFTDTGSTWPLAELSPCLHSRLLRALAGRLHRHPDDPDIQDACSEAWTTT
jgi:hypothetical protein